MQMGFKIELKSIMEDESACGKLCDAFHESYKTDSEKPDRVGYSLIEAYMNKNVDAALKALCGYSLKGLINMSKGLSSDGTDPFEKEVWWRSCGKCYGKHVFEVLFRHNGIDYVLKKQVADKKACEKILVDTKNWLLERFFKELDKPVARIEYGKLYANVVCIKGPTTNPTQGVFVGGIYRVEKGLFHNHDGNSFGQIKPYFSIAHLNEDWANKDYEFKLL